jgi:predicted Zn-dependent protease
MTIRANSSTPTVGITGAQDFNHPKLAITYRLANQAKIDNRHRIVCRLSPHSDQ